MRRRSIAGWITGVVGLTAALAGSQPLSAGAADSFPVIATVNVGTNPFGDTVSPDGATVWVANSGTVTSNSNTVTVLDTRSYAILSRITVGRFPEDIAFAYAGSQASVTNSTDASVSIISTATRSVTQTVSLAPVPMEFPFGIIATKDSTKLSVTSAGGQSDTSLQNIAVLNNTNPANVLLDGAIRVQGFTGRSALTPDGSLLVVALSHGGGPPEVLFVNPATNAIVGNLQLLDLLTNGAAQSVQITPDGRFAYVDIYGQHGGVWVIDLATRSTLTVVRLDTEVFGGAVTPNGRFVFATEFDLAKVAVINSLTNTVVATLSVGNLPNDVAVTPDSSKAFVTNQGDTTVSVISIPSP